jgi:hypothetical protein
MNTPFPQSGLSPPDPRYRTGIMALLLATLALFSGVVPSRAGLLDGLTVGGHVKSLNLRVEPSPAGSYRAGVISLNSLRLTMNATLGASCSFEAAVENSLLYSHPVGLADLSGPSQNRLLDLNQIRGEGNPFSDRMQIDRLCLHGRNAGLEWSVGRQALGFGRILLFSPLDVIAPFAPDAIDTDVRPGVDAVRLVRYFGLGGEIGAVAVLDDQPHDRCWLLTLSWNSHGLDLLGLAGSLRNRPMAGFGVAGDLKGLGIKSEIALYGGKQPGRSDGDLHHAFAIGALELWYRFANDLVLVGQYLYNGAGAADPDDYPRAQASAPLREGLSFLLGQHYLLLNPSYEIHPLVTLSGLAICNLADASCLLRPTVECSLSDNLSLLVFWSFNLGRQPDAATLRPRSEFGSRGDAGGAFLTWYF